MINAKAMITNAALHHAILSHIVEHGHAPGNQLLAANFGVTLDEVTEALHSLQEYHGIVLHPHKAEPWVIHPFALSPTNFLVRSERGTWWGNCAWCSLGVAALLKEDLSIITTLGAYDEQVVISIVKGEIQQKELYIHFPIPMKNAWDNVIYTCSTMLVFRDEAQIDTWCKRHNVPKGDIQPIDNIWQFSKKWYGNHLDPNWTKWTMQEAKALFAEFALTGRIWDLEENEGRF